MTTTDPANQSADRGIEYSASSEAWLRQTLEQILSQIRRPLDISGAAFLIIDWSTRTIRPAAAWFPTEEAHSAFVPILRRPYDAQRPGVTELAVEGREPLLVKDIEKSVDTKGLQERLVELLGAEAAAHTWRWYQSSTFISCPVETAAGRVLGVLVISSTPPSRPLETEDLAFVDVFARLSALALERSELLEREAARTREEALLKQASQEITRSLNSRAVATAILDQVTQLVGAEKVLLTQYSPATQELSPFMTLGHSEEALNARFALGEGMIGRVAQSGEPYLNDDSDSSEFLDWVVKEDIRSFIHMPIQLGSRLFGVLTASHSQERMFDAESLRILQAFARSAAEALANAFDYEREQRVAHALASGFVPAPLPELDGIDVGVVYAPAGQEVGGGDLFGVWKLPSGAVSILLGDVSGKGLEVAAQSAMVRFFIEARSWDSEDPAEVLAQTNALLWHRLPSVQFVPAFFGVIKNDELHYCNAGHPSPILVNRDGDISGLARTGTPLGIETDASFSQRVIPFKAHDLLFAATDGLLEARRDNELFGDKVLPELLRLNALTAAPGELAGMVYSAAEDWAPELNDDLVILVVRACPPN